MRYVVYMTTQTPEYLARTDYDMVTAEDAPTGVLTWPVTREDARPNFTLDEVAIIRTANGTRVRWTYRNGNQRTFALGEQVALRLETR